MHKRTLSWGLHWGRQVQKRLAERAYADVGEKHRHDQQNCREVPPGELLNSGMFIQSECIFLQHVTWDTGNAFKGVEKMIRKTFLPRIFFRNTKTLSSIIGTLSTMPIKVTGIGLLNQETSETEKCPSSQQGSAELIRAMTGGGAFSHANHLQTLGE